MVSSSSRRNRRGGSTLGCLVSLLVFVAAVYYGIHIGEVYWRYYQLVDEMKLNARLAPNLADDVIQRRLQAKVQEVFGDDRSMKFRISRVVASARSPSRRSTATASACRCSSAVSSSSPGPKSRFEIGVEPRVPRPDGRSSDQLRPLVLERAANPYAEGSCLIRMGGTLVHCTATVEPGVPGFKKGSGEGWVTGNTPCFRERPSNERPASGTALEDVPRRFSA